MDGHCTFGDFTAAHPIAPVPSRKRVQPKKHGICGATFSVRSTRSNYSFTQRSALLMTGRRPEPGDSKWLQEWRKQTDNLNMGKGRIIMVIMICGVIERLMRLSHLNVLGDRETCGVTISDGPTMTIILVVCELALLVANGSALVFNFIHPEKHRHYAILLIFWYFHILLVSVPPFRQGCMAYAWAFIRTIDKQCDAKKVENLVTTLINADCSLQGHGVTQLLIVWILGSYLIIPSYRRMKWNWVFIFLVYMPANFLWYHHIGGDAVYQPWDVASSIVLLSMSQVIAQTRKFDLEKSALAQAMADAEEKQYARVMLISLRDQLPHHVISPMLSRPNETYGCRIECVTVMFIFIHDFDSQVRAMDAKSLLRFLNITFRRWDDIMLEHNVTIIETVGEEYVCAVGVEPAQQVCPVKEHHRLVKLCLDAAIEVLQEQTDQLKVKIGMHTGEIYTGVIGKKLPRFRLFGDVVNTAARMMQKSPVGMLQFGKETYQYVDCELPMGVLMSEEKGLPMKGKGNIDVWRILLDPLVQPVSSDGISEAPQRSALKPSAALTFALERMSSNIAAECSDSDEDGDGPIIARDSLKGKDASQIAGYGALNIRSSQKRIEFLQARSGSQVSGGGTSALNPDEVPEEVVDVKRTVTFKGEDSDVVVIPGACGDAEDVLGQSIRNLDSCRTEFEAGGEKDTTAEDEAAVETLLNDISSAKGKTKMAMWKKARSFWLRSGFFDDALEDEWFLWQHQTLLCHDLHQRLQNHEIMIFLITTYDCVMFLFFYYSLRVPFCPHRLYGAGPACRLPVFLLCRFLSYLIVHWWKLQAPHDFQTDHSTTEIVTTAAWLPRRAKIAQWGTALSYVVILLLFFVSYDAISNTQENWVENLAAKYGSAESEALMEAFAHRLRTHWRYTSVNAFMFLLSGTLIYSSHPWPFGFCLTFSCVGLTFAAVLRSKAWLTESGHSTVSIYFSTTSRILIQTFMVVLFARTAYLLEKDSRGRFKALKNLEETKCRVDDILNRLMPPQILSEMADMEPGRQPAHFYEHCTVAQSDLCGFTQLASTLAPREVVDLVSDLFGRFDAFADQRGVWKVETVGDAYIAATAESPLTQNHLAISAVAFGKDMVNEAKGWSKANNTGVTCRVGVHHGSCVGGIASNHMRRYHLFGELMSVVELLESTGVRSRVQVSTACKEKVEAEIMSARPLPEELEIKGFTLRAGDSLESSKQEKHSYDEVGGRTWLVEYTSNVSIVSDVPRKRSIYRLQSAYAPALPDDSLIRKLRSSKRDSFESDARRVALLES